MPSEAIDKLSSYYKKVTKLRKPTDPRNPTITK
jgi:hypothetical protein